MNRKLIAKLVCIVLLVSLFVGIMQGCKTEEKKTTVSEDTAKQELKYIETSASSVNFNDSGVYTTTIQASKKNIKADDVVISYPVFDYKGYSDAVSKSIIATAASDSNSEVVNPTKDAEVNVELFFSYKTAEIKEIKSNDNGTMTITFFDKDAAANNTDSYDVFIKGDNIITYVDVNFDEYKVTADIDKVSPNDHDIKVTLEIDGSTFGSNLDRSSIVLGGSFANMEIASISNSDRYLTMLLTGDIAYSEVGHCWEDGVITVKESAIRNGSEDALVSMRIDYDSLLFDSTRLYYNDGIVTLPIIASNIIDTKNIKRSDIVFDGGVTVNGVYNNNDEIVLLLVVDGATDVNSAAKILSGKKMKLGEIETYVDINVASFYPVFDLIKKEGENFVVGVKMYANNGKFGDIKASDITLYDDFAGATIKNVIKESDSVVNVEMTIGANGKTIKDFDMNGGITLKKGSMFNEWATPSDEVSFSRNYSESNLGKDLSSGDIDAIKNIVGGFGNTTFGTIKDVASGIGTAYSIANTVLQFLGYTESDADKTMNLITNMNRELNAKLDEQKKILQSIHKDVSKLGYADYDRRVSYLETSNKLFNAYITKAVAELQAKGIEKPEEMNEYNKHDKDLKGRWDAYEAELVNHMKTEAKNGNENYANLEDDFKRLKEDFRRVVDSVALKQAKDAFNEFCSLTYNTDTLAYDTRILYYSKIQRAMADGMKSILLYEKNATTIEVDKANYSDSYDVVAKEISSSRKASHCSFYHDMPYFYGASKQASGSQKYGYAYMGYDTSFNFLELSNDFGARMQYDTVDKELSKAGFGISKADMKGIAIKYTDKKKVEICWYDQAFMCYYREYYFDVLNWDGSVENVAVFKRAASKKNSVHRYLQNYASFVIS